jgi:hypothetical protein
MEKVGFYPTSQAKARPARLMEKVFRKGMRMAAVAPLAHLASLAGAGPCMEVVFRKQ